MSEKLLVLWLYYLCFPLRVRVKEQKLTKDPKDSAGGQPHTSNARKSTKTKHEAGQASKKMSRGGESGDERREFPRRKPYGWRGGWPPIKFANMEHIVIQVSLRTKASREIFRRELQFWASQSKLITEYKVESGEDGNGFYWNLNLQCCDTYATWNSLGYVVKHFDNMYRAQCRRTGYNLSDPSRCPPTIVVASREAAWDEYVMLHHTDPDTPLY